MNQWLDWGDVTATVDPIRNTHWINDDSERHHETHSRGAKYDAARVRDMIGWEERAAAEHRRPVPFTPSSSSFDSVRKWGAREEETGLCANTRGGGWNMDRFNKLPVLFAKMYDGSLPNKSQGQIEAEMRESARRQSHRIFSREGLSR